MAFNPDDHRPAHSWEIKGYTAAGFLLTEEEADALPPNSLYTGQDGQWYFKKREFTVGFFIANYTDSASHSALLKAIEMQGGVLIERTEKYLVARFPGRAGNPKLVIDNTYGWCWGR